MPRLDPLTWDEVDPEIRQPMQDGAAMMGFMPNDALTMARNPALLQATWQLVAATLGRDRPDSRVDGALKRLIGLAASRSAGCDYCQAHTVFSALKQGVDRDKIRALDTFEDSPAFSPAEKAAIRVAGKSAQAPNGVTDADFTALKQHFSDDDITDIVAVIALFGFLNRWNSTLLSDIEAEPTACMLSL